MDLWDEFNEIYESLAGSRPLYRIIKHITTGIPRWRIQILEKGTARIGGDMLLLSIERPTEEECLEAAIEGMKKMIR